MSHSLLQRSATEGVNGYYSDVAVLNAVQGYTNTPLIEVTLIAIERANDRMLFALPI